jgi:hypothetical protein
MTRGRRWIGRVALIALLVVFHTAAWWVAIAALRGGTRDWAARQRAGGTDVALGDLTPAGWPFAATLRFHARLGPGGLPAGLVVDADLTTGIALDRPRVIETAIRRARVSGGGIGPVVATAAAWTMDLAWAHPDHVWIEASDWRADWTGGGIGVASWRADSTPTDGAGLHFMLTARDLDLGHAVRVPPALGDRVAGIELDAALPAGPPPVAPTAQASATAWRGAGGAIDLNRLAVRYGPLDASVSGRLALDAALRPAGSLAVSARGLPAFVDALGAWDGLPPRTGQAVAGVLALLAGGGGEPVSLPVVLADGRVSVAGFPLARLPRLGWEPP